MHISSTLRGTSAIYACMWFCSALAHLLVPEQERTARTSVCDRGSRGIYLRVAGNRLDTWAGLYCMI